MKFFDILKIMLLQDFIRNGGNIVLLRDQLSHSNIETTSLYTNLSNKDNEQVLTRMETNRLKPADRKIRATEKDRRLSRLSVLFLMCFTTELQLLALFSKFP